MHRVAATGALTIAVLWGIPSAPAGASGGGGCGGPVTDVTDVTGTGVSIKEFCFQPTVLRAGQGAVVTFTNDDPFPHNVLGANGAWGSFETIQRRGGSLSYRFPDPGVYSYTCLWHPGMTGAIVIGDSGAGSTDPTAIRMVPRAVALAEAGEEKTDDETTAGESIAAEPAKLERERFSPQPEDWFLVGGFAVAWLALAALLRRRRNA